jgi:hypothetical protein
MKATIVFGRRLRYPTSIFGSTGLLNHSYVISSNIIPMKKKKKLLTKEEILRETESY